MMDTQLCTVTQNSLGLYALCPRRKVRPCANVSWHNNNRKVTVCSLAFSLSQFPSAESQVFHFTVLSVYVFVDLLKRQQSSATLSTQRGKVVPSDMPMPRGRNGFIDLMFRVYLLHWEQTRWLVWRNGRRAGMFGEGRPVVHINWIPPGPPPVWVGVHQQDISCWRGTHMWLVTRGSSLSPLRLDTFSLVFGLWCVFFSLLLVICTYSWPIRVALKHINNYECLLAILK